MNNLVPNVESYKLQVMFHLNYKKSLILNNVNIFET